MGIYTALVTAHEFLDPIGILMVALSRKAVSMLPMLPLTCLTDVPIMHARNGFFFFFDFQLLACG